MVKNCDLGLENADLGLLPRALFSRRESKFFTIRISQPANNIYLFLSLQNIPKEPSNHQKLTKNQLNYYNRKVLTSP